MAADQERTPAARRPGAAHSVLPSRVPWSHHCGAREQSAGGCDDSSRVVVELAAARKGTSSPPFRPFPNSTEGYRDCCGSPRRGQIGRLHAPARYAVLESRDTRVGSEGHWPRFGPCVPLAGSLRPRRSTRRPLVTRRSLSSHSVAQGSGHNGTSITDPEAQP